MEETEHIELLSRFETIDFDTGELINVLDPELPVRGRVDTARWLIDRFTGEIEQCKERKKLWNARESSFKFGIEKIRATIRDHMLNAGIDKINTLENSVYLTDKTILIFDEDKVLPEQKTYDLTIKGASLQIFERLKSYSEAVNLVCDFKENINPETLPQELVKPVIKKSITFRKSPKSKN